MPLTIYGMVLSPPVRTVLLVSKSIGTPYDYKVVNLFAGEHKNPNFLKLNPIHTIPTIDDNGTVLFDSHAIAAYLVGKYAKNDSLYPKDLVKRAIVDQRLHYDSGTLFLRLREHVLKVLAGDCIITDDIKTRTTDTLKDLELLLDDNDWIAHTPSYTIADIALLSTLENIEAMAPYIQNFPKLAAWRERAQAKITDYSKLTKEGIAEFTELVASKVKSA